MKQITVLAVLIILSISGSFAQDKNLKKIEADFNNGKYEKCISRADKYISTNSKTALPYFLQSFSYFELYKSNSDLTNLKSSGKLLSKGITKNQSEVYIAEYSDKFNELKDTLHKVADRLYAQKPAKSKVYYKYLAEIYNDTTAQYHEFYDPKDNRPDADIIKDMKAGKLNQTDNKGMKQGKWKKVYDNGRPAYEVTFKDNKPVGELIRYHRNGQVQAKLNYEKDGITANAKLFNEFGKLIAEGKYIGKKKEGEWKYYDNEILIKLEFYKDGKLEGKQKIYYNDGKIYDEKIFVNGVENGLWVKYHHNGQVALKCQVKDGKFNGNLLRWYPSGTQEVIGQYVNDLPEGKWTYFSEDGSQKQDINYVKGVPENQAELDEKQAEEYKKTLEMSKRLLDPADYRTNPEEYKRKTEGN